MGEIDEELESEFRERLTALHQTVEDFNKWISSNNFSSQPFVVCQISDENAEFVSKNYDTNRRCLIRHILLDESLNTLRRIKTNVESE
jgi:hypothetical protein